MIGIYKITNKNNGKSYIGQSIHCGKRLDEHYKGNQLIDSIIQIEGIENFSFEILKEAEKDKLSYWEDYYIIKYNTMFPEGYNKKWNCNSNIREKIYNEIEKEKKEEEENQSVKIVQNEENVKYQRCKKEGSIKFEQNEEPWKEEILNQDEIDQIIQWNKEFSEKYCEDEKWIGNFDNYKKYKYNKRKNMQNRGEITQLKKITYSDKIFTQAQLNYYNSFRLLIEQYNNKKTLWRMKYEECWSDEIYGPNGKESGYSPVSCGIYETKQDLRWCKVEFKDKKIILNEILFDNRGVLNEMLISLIKRKTINISNFRFFKNEIEIPIEDLVEKKYIDINKIEILEEQD